MSKFRDKKIKGMSVEVHNDDVNKAIRILSKKVQESGLLREIKDRMSYEPRSVKKQRLKKESRKRWEKTVENLIFTGKWHQDKKY